MSAYSEFKLNPWNFLTRKLKLTIKEKDLEEQIASGISDMNYRNIMLYQNNGLNPCKDLLDYELLSSVKGITVVLYLFDLDTYIIDTPRDIEASCMHVITVINRTYSQSDYIQINDSSYGLDNLYYLLSRYFKMVYDPPSSSIYLEGSNNSSLWFFKSINQFKCKASIRIYATKFCLHAKDRWTCDCQMPAIISTLNNCQKLYQNLSLPIRTLEKTSYGLDYLKQYLNSNPIDAHKMLMNYPVYKTGVSIQDMTNIMQLIETLNIGKRIEKNYELNVSSYDSRFSNYAFLACLQDCIIGLFFNSNSKIPFHHSTAHKESIFIYINHYCYYIGKTPDRFSYSFSEFTINLCENNIVDETSFLIIKDNKYHLMGDWKITCTNPIAFSDITKGSCKCLYYTQTNPVCKLLESQ